MFTELLKTARLVSLPDIYFRMKTILEDPDFTMAEVAVVISQDPAITVRLLRLVNCSLFGFAAKVETVSRAIVLLGSQQVHDLVLATAIAHVFRGMSSEIMDMRRFWLQSVRCAAASHQLAAIAGGCSRDRLFVAGLLHDIGHLIMYQAIPDLSLHALLAAREQGRPLYEVERDLIGFDYSRAGGELLSYWSLPESLRETTMFHNEPGRAERYRRETALVHLGVLLTRSIGGEGEFNEGLLTADPSVWPLTGLSPQACAALSELIAEESDEVVGLIFPGEVSVSR
jgi:HD-like signal output (HDOD) protein